MGNFILSFKLFLSLLVISGCNYGKEKKQDKEKSAQEKIEPENMKFRSTDGLLISAHFYASTKDAPVMILCHQAGYNKMEYAEIAHELVKKGFSCLSLDQRSGGSLKGHINETHARALRKEYKTTYLDAEKDIVAAVNHVSKTFDSPIILVGSSYSASLALKIAAEMKEVWAVAAFSPGEYFGDWLKLEPSIQHLDKPVFVTSSKDEADEVHQLIEKIDSKIKQQYIPVGFEGVHGAKALWPEYEHSDKYWNAFNEYIGKLKEKLG